MMKLVKDLLLALVNATLLLLIGLVVLLLMLVNRTDDLAHDVMAGLAPAGESLEDIAAALEKIEADLEAATDGDAIAVEVVALRAEVAALRAPLDAVSGLTADGIALALANRLAAAPGP